MCSPGKPTPRKKEAQAKFAKPSTPAKEPKKTPKKTPRSLRKARGGLPTNLTELTVEECYAVADKLKDMPDDHPDRDKRHVFSDLPGKPRISLASWAHDEKAPFLLVVRKTGSKYIPKGEEPNRVLLNLLIKEIHQKKLDVKNPRLICIIFDGLNGYAIQGALERVEAVFKNASLLQYLDNFAQKDDVQAVVNQIQARFIENEAKVDALAFNSLLDLRRTSLNHNLRCNPNEPWFLNKANLIDQHLEPLPSHLGICYRGINTQGLPHSLVLGWHQVNSIYVDEGFTTASLSKEVAWSYAGADPNCRVVFQIQSVTGRIMPSNVGFPTDQEISFKRGTKFRILSAHTYNFCQPNQFVLVCMEEFDPDL